MRERGFEMKQPKTWTYMGAFLLMVLVLAGCSQAASVNDLEGTSWTVTEMGGTPLVEGTSITAQFADGKIGGSAGCNSYGGTYEVTTEGVSISDLTSTMMACTDPGVMEQEQQFLDTIQNIQSFDVGSDKLTITSADGTQIVFAPASAEINTTTATP